MLTNRCAPLKDLLIYSEHVETSLRQDNQHLRGQINDANLDLADATKSRRELQQRVKELEHQIAFVSMDNEHLKVDACADFVSWG